MISSSCMGMSSFLSFLFVQVKLCATNFIIEDINVKFEQEISSSWWNSDVTANYEFHWKWYIVINGSKNGYPIRQSTGASSHSIMLWLMRQWMRKCSIFGSLAKLKLLQLCQWTNIVHRNMIPNDGHTLLDWN